MVKNNHKILVIDDEPEITDIVKAFLTNAGYQVFRPLTQSKGRRNSNPTWSCWIL
jgi:DNA-binding response OmpR family regulator